MSSTAHAWRCRYTVGRNRGRGQDCCISHEPSFLEIGLGPLPTARTWLSPILLAGLEFSVWDCMFEERRSIKREIDDGWLLTNQRIPALEVDHA